MSRKGDAMLSVADGFGRGWPEYYEWSESLSWREILEVNPRVGALVCRLAGSNLPIQLFTRNLEFQDSQS